MRGMRFASAGLLLSIACTAHAPTVPSDLASTREFVSLLEHLGARVSVAETMPRESFPFFSVNAQRLLVNGQSVHVFEYPDPTTATEEAGRVAAPGSPIGETQITWVDPPRFYKSTHLIVLYVGRNEGVVRLLEDVFGRPFAGAR